MSSYYVITRSHSVGNNWVNTNLALNVCYPNKTHVVIITNPTQLRGHKIEHGILLTGWREIPRIREILDLLLVNGLHQNPTIKALYEELI